MKVTREQTARFRKKDQPRSDTEKSELLALGQNMLKYKQQVPVIAYRDENGFVIVDGHRRVEASGLVGITEIDAVILDHVPTEGEVHILQMITAAHDVGLPAIDRGDLLLKIKNENSWTVTELAANLNIKQPLVSKLLPLAKLSAELRAILRDADQEKVYLVASEPDPAKQLELAKLAAGMTRDQLRAKARGLVPKSKSAAFPMNGFTVTLRGRAFVVKDAIRVLQAVISELKHAEREAWDISTLAKVLDSRTKAAP